MDNPTEGCAYTMIPRPQSRRTLLRLFATHPICNAAYRNSRRQRSRAPDSGADAGPCEDGVVYQAGFCRLGRLLRSGSGGLAMVWGERLGIHRFYVFNSSRFSSASTRGSPRTRSLPRKHAPLRCFSRAARRAKAEYERIFRAPPATGRGCANSSRVRRSRATIGTRDNFDIEIQIAHHPLNRAQLLKIFFAKNREVRLHDVEQLGDHRRPTPRKCPDGCSRIARVWTSVTSTQVCESGEYIDTGSGANTTSTGTVSSIAQSRSKSLG